ncbi:MAG: sigma-E processing peptidase SpoIIGA [Tissierellia bacterium]|nr:sigma-E processing peptidase SpoIIGA [Tissierellia bacterium]
MYVVAEYLFLENFLINFAILHITKLITRTKANSKRILMASILAALYPFVLFVPSFIFLTNFFMKILISIIIVKIAFNSKSIELFIKQLFGFYIVSFIFAGASIGIYYFLQNYSNFSMEENVFSRDFPIKYLILGIALGGILIKNVFDYYQEKIAREKELYEVTIYFDDKNISLIALLDTGNSLIEPLSKLPVFIVEYETIKELIPTDLRQGFTNKVEDLLQIQKLLEDMNKKNLIRIIPFKTIGSKKGFLLGFKPDFIEIIKNSDRIICDNLIIGIFKGKLSTDDQYKGLLSLEILNRGNIYVKEY